MKIKVRFEAYLNDTIEPIKSEILEFNTYKKTKALNAKFDKEIKIWIKRQLVLKYKIIGNEKPRRIIIKCKVQDDKC
jgi:hypothetical protein